MGDTAGRMAKSDKTAPETSTPVLRDFFRSYLRPQGKYLVGALIFMTLEGLMLGALSYLIKPMFDDVLVAEDTSGIAWVSFSILGVFFIRAISAYFNKLLQTVVRQRTAAQIQSDLVAHILTLDGAFFHKYPPGLLLERSRGDSQMASLQWGLIFSTLIKDVIGLISLLVVALSIDWKWTAMVLVAVPFIALPVGALQRLVRRSSGDAREASADVSNRLDEVFHGSTSIKLAGTEAREITRFERSVFGYVRQEIRAMRGHAAIPSLIDFVAGIGFCAVIFYGGHQIIAGHKTVGEFMAFFTAMGLVFEPARRLGNVSGVWQTAMASLDRVYEIFNQRPTVVSPSKPAKLAVSPAQADVQFDDVVFSYTDTPVLRGASFTAKAGETTALVGASGAGKSTIFHLLTRLADPQGGTITIGGTRGSALELSTLRGLFSVVSQDALLFDESIRDNVVMGAKVSQEDLDNALKAAHVDDFVSRLEAGLETKAGPRGSALSGGQRQRVAIARAVLRNKPVLLLDEATSALDAQSEKIVQEALEALSQDRTTIVIAHRLSTIRNADNIVVMDKGEVVDQGTHDALLARGGLYADLYRLQYADGRTVSDGGDSLGPDAQAVSLPDTVSGAKGSGLLARASRALGSVTGLFARRRD